MFAVLVVAALAMALSTENAFAVHVGTINPPAPASETLFGGDFEAKTLTSMPAGKSTEYVTADVLIGASGMAALCRWTTTRSISFIWSGRASLCFSPSRLFTVIAAWWRRCVSSTYLNSSRDQRATVAVADIAWRPPPLRPLRCHQSSGPRSAAGRTDPLQQINPTAGGT